MCTSLRENATRQSPLWAWEMSGNVRFATLRAASLLYDFTSKVSPAIEKQWESEWSAWLGPLGWLPGTKIHTLRSQGLRSQSRNPSILSHHSRSGFDVSFLVRGGHWYMANERGQLKGRAILNSLSACSWLYCSNGDIKGSDTALKQKCDNYTACWAAWGLIQEHLACRLLLWEICWPVSKLGTREELWSNGKWSKSSSDPRIKYSKLCIRTSGMSSIL